MRAGEAVVSDGKKPHDESDNITAEAVSNSRAPNTRMVFTDDPHPVAALRGRRFDDEVVPQAAAELRGIAADQHLAAFLAIVNSSKIKGLKSAAQTFDTDVEKLSCRAG